MDIITNNLDGKVLFAEEVLRLDDNGAYGNGWTYPKGNLSNMILYHNVELPEGFSVGAFSYDGTSFTKLV